MRLENDRFEVSYLVTSSIFICCLKVRASLKNPSKTFQIDKLYYKYEFWGRILKSDIGPSDVNSQNYK